jgi:TPR repeat protein
MTGRILTSGLIAMLLTGSALAEAHVVPLGSDSTSDADPVAACGALAASRDEEGWGDRGLTDKQVFLNGAQAACEAAVQAAPASDAAKTWLARVYILIGRPDDAARLLEEATGTGNGFAAYLLSGLTSNGYDDGVEDDPDRSLQLLRQASDAGFTPASVELAGRYEAGEGVDPDIAEAVSLYRAAADKGNGRAIYKLGALTQAGDGIEQDYARALELFQQAADAGEPLGYSGFGQLYQNGQGVAQDYSKAASAYRQGADQGEPQSEAGLAYLYEQGLGVEQDYDKSFALLTDSAAQGYGFGQAALAIHYLFGQGVGSDPGKALSLGLQAIDKHVNYANGVVGYMYAEGLGTTRDLGAAQMYYQSGWEGGDQYSADRLKITELEIACEDAAGSQYEPGGVGHGVDFDAIDAEAAITACSTAVDANPESVGDGTWLARAYIKAERYSDALPLARAGSDAGNVLAQTLYADLLVLGRGVHRDTEAAFELYNRAAEDFPLAAFTLGRIYQEGEIVPGDNDKAIEWYRRAYEYGVEGAEEKLAELGAPPSTQ